MTGEPTHTTSKERMAHELMLSSERELGLGLPIMLIFMLFRNALCFHFVFFSK